MKMKSGSTTAAGQRAHNQGEEEGIKRQSSGTDGREGDGEVAKSPLLTGQSPTERSGQGQVSRDPAGGKCGERDCDNGRSKVREVKVAEDSEEVNTMKDEEWEDSKRPPVLFIMVDMRSKSLSDRSLKSSDQWVSQVNKRRQSYRLSLSVRCEDQKGQSRG